MDNKTRACEVLINISELTTHRTIFLVTESDKYGFSSMYERISALLHTTVSFFKRGVIRGRTTKRTELSRRVCHVRSWTKECSVFTDEREDTVCSQSTFFCASVWATPKSVLCVCDVYFERG